MKLICPSHDPDNDNGESNETRETENERAFIEKILHELGGDIAKSAHALQITVEELRRLISNHRLGLN